MSVLPVGLDSGAAPDSDLPSHAARRAEEVLALLQQATEANRNTVNRQGNVVHLSATDADDVFISADLHGHWQNYWWILEQADLDRHPRRHLILQEVCHGGPVYKNDFCCSHAMLEAVAELKLRYPDRVHFLLSNHELSELTGHPIRKDGRMLLISFMLGVHYRYGAQADVVHSAYGEFVASCPLAVRIGRDVFVSHSTPEGVVERGYDVSVLERNWNRDDLHPHGAVFDLVWGRDYRRENAEAFAQAVSARWLINGHTPCPGGYNTPNEQQLILDCSGSPATCLLVPTTGASSMDELLRGLRPLGPQRAADSSSTSASSESTSSPSSDSTSRKGFNLANITESLQEAMKIEGALAAAVVDSSSGMCLGATGTHVDLEVAAAGNTEVVRAKLRVMSNLKIDDKIEDILITLGKEYHLIRLMEKDRGLFLYLILRRSSANLALARRKLQDIEGTLKV